RVRPAGLLAACARRRDRGGRLRRPVPPGHPRLPGIAPRGHRGAALVPALGEGHGRAGGGDDPGRAAGDDRVRRTRQAPRPLRRARLRCRPDRGAAPRMRSLRRERRAAHLRLGRPDVPRAGADRPRPDRGARRIRVRGSAPRIAAVSLLIARDLSLRYGGKVLFDGASFVLGSRDRAGLIGPNGSGKSSLLKLLAGRLEPDAGEVQLVRKARAGYLPQELAELPPGSVLEGVLASVPGRRELEARLEAAQAAVETARSE